MDPSAPSQPNQQTSYNQPDNPTSQTDPESATATDTSTSAAPEIDRRVPSDHNEDARPSALGAGDTGPLQERRTEASESQQASDKSHLDGEQMRAPGEGDVADAQRTERKEGMGIGGDQGDLMGDMDRKKEEHRDALEEQGKSVPRTAGGDEVPEDDDWTGKKGAVDLGEALGGRGPAVVLAADE